jgi:hypothetical protein
VSSMICLVAIYWQCRTVMFYGVQYDLSCRYILTMWESYVLWCPVWSENITFPHCQYIATKQIILDTREHNFPTLSIYSYKTDHTGHQRTYLCGTVMFYSVQYDLSCSYILTMWESYVPWCPVWSVL